MPDNPTDSQTDASKAPTERRKRLLPFSTASSATTRRWHGLSLRYAAIVLGSGLLMFSGSARVLGALNGTVKPQVALMLLATLIAMACFLAAAMPITAPLSWHSWYKRLRLPVYILAGFLVMGMIIVFAGTLNLAWQSSPRLVYTNDVLSFTHVNAQLVLAGKNPYVCDSAFTTALRDYPEAYPTPLRQGVFANEDGLSYPDLIALRKNYLADPEALKGALDPRTLHSYPALSFLLYVPFLWVGVPNILLLNLLLCFGLLGWLAWQAPPRWRLAALLTAGTAFGIVYSLPVDTEIVCIVLLLAAWHLQHLQRTTISASSSSNSRLQGWASWLAPALFGLACAFKQYAWFFVPCFVLDVLLTQGWRATVRWAGLALVAFLLPNLPYIIASPVPWLQSIFLPMTDPLFPQGAGIMVLSLGHLLPFGPPAFYAVLEVIALLVMIWVQIRYHAKLGDAALLLALIPFLFAFRSPPNYFAFAPWLALYAANRIYSKRFASAQKPAIAANGT